MENKGPENILVVPLSGKIDSAGAPAAEAAIRARIAECSPEYGEDIYAGAGDFSAMCRDFTFDPAELDAAGAIDKSVTALAREILALAE